MKKREKASKIACVGLLASALTFNNYSIMFDAKADTVSNSSANSQVVILTKDATVDRTIEQFEDQNKDAALTDVQEKLENKEIQVDVTDSSKDTVFDEDTSIFADATEVEGNSQYQKVLKQELNDGNRVFLYGDVSAEEYKDILGLDKITVDNDSAGDLEFGSSNDEIKSNIAEDKNSKVKEDEFFKDTESKFTSHIIGYTLDDSKELQFIDISVNNFDGDGKSIPNSESMLMQEVMSTQSEILDAENEHLADEAENNKTSMIGVKKAHATNVRVKDTYNLVAKGYRLGLLVARMDTDYHLYKQNSDGNKKYDYFTLKPVTQVHSYKGIWAGSILTDIDVPSDSDHLDTWAPMGDRGGAKMSVSLGFPFNISAGMSFSESLVLDDRSSLAYDYARWQIKDSAIELNQNISGTTFNPVAGWASTGTYATVGLKVVGSFSNYITLTTKTKVTYDY
ncbi:hypothetical protein [Listeria booriae]|uniref:hypothetical protein n=1 Tax=Listeria booriae TaxID=1552123 RepID=UPI0016241FEE|nr:hypothetical protein [Listeria booriae]MBC2306066.1 hypothetical protein [Listeria booriae]